MRRVIGSVTGRRVGLYAGPRWSASSGAVTLAANGGMGRVILSVPLALIRSRADFDQVLARVKSGNYGEEAFLAAIGQAWIQRYGKTLAESLAEMDAESPGDMPTATP